MRKRKEELVSLDRSSLPLPLLFTPSSSSFLSVYLFLSHTNFDPAEKMTNSLQVDREPLSNPSNLQRLNLPNSLLQRHELHSYRLTRSRQQRSYSDVVLQWDEGSRRGEMLDEVGVEI